MQFDFQVGKNRTPPSGPGVTSVFLETNTWNDYGYGTTFDIYLHVNGSWKSMGVVKIGSRGQLSSDELPADVYTSFVSVPRAFVALSTEYFSLGQDADYYEDLVHAIGANAARELLTALRDVAIVPGLFEEVAEEEVLQTSLMRSVSSRSLEAYRRIVYGDLEKRDFELSYSLRPMDPLSPRMIFRTGRARRIPSNVHVLIGSNGTGKTTALSKIRWAFEANEWDGLHPSAVSISDREQIAALLSISFSAFDTFPARERTRRDQLDFRITNVRLPWIGERQILGPGREVRSPEATGARDVEMGKFVRDETLGCLAERADRLLPALSLLAEADPVLDRYGVGTEEGLQNLDFSALSSGHKIAVLMIASLVRYSEDRTLVLLDEPESHLHPPLLGAVTRALSDLMSSVNGLAIVATHSPVVLQEVPRRCAWIIWNLGGESRVEQPGIETFGANLGVLTREIFDLELSRSGYHALLQGVANESASFDEAIRKIDDEVGDEARMLLRSMMRRRGDRQW